MSRLTSQFFETLPQRPPQPLPRQLWGTLRCDLRRGAQTDHWYLTLGKDGIDVSHSDADADCVMRTDEKTFESFVTGRTNAMSAFLRGEAEVEGKTILVEALQALFPGPQEHEGQSRDTAA